MHVRLTKLLGWKCSCHKIDQNEGSSNTPLLWHWQQDRLSISY